MATASLVPGTTAEEKFESIVAAMSRFAGRRLVMDDDVYESEAATNDYCNRGIAHLLDGYGPCTATPISPPTSTPANALCSSARGTWP